MTFNHHRAAPWALAAAMLLTSLAGCAGRSMSDGLRLTGAQEVPPVSTAGSGSASFTVSDDGAMSGTVKTIGVAGTAAHIHMGAAGVNGPVIVPLTKSAEGVWSVPAGARLTAEQLKAYRAGGLYVNVHTDANKGGEVRAQLVP